VYQYSALIQRVVDGDTLDLEIDLGFSVLTRQRIRLRGIDAPELSTTAGKEALQFVRDLLARHGSKVRVNTFKDEREKYGRMLAEVVLDDGNGPSLNAELLAASRAEPYDGGRRGPAGSSVESV
jgi:endonuclease YncB( thermonuclease family)